MRPPYQNAELDQGRSIHGVRRRDCLEMLTRVRKYDEILHVLLYMDKSFCGLLH